MNIRSLLDDVAADATRGLRIDLELAHRQADRRRARVRRRVSAALVAGAAVAAAIVLALALLPGALLRSAPAPAATAPGTPTGLPAQWFDVPPWVPPVTRHPMTAASTVLSAPLEVGRFRDSRVPGPVLVSADGKQYASLPWGRWDGQVALSADGTQVAWVTQGDGSGRGPGRPVVHTLRLRDGHRRDWTLARRTQVQQVLWVGDRLGVVRTGPGAATWLADPRTGGRQQVCACAPRGLGTDGLHLLIPENRINPADPGGAQIPQILTPAGAAHEPARQDVTDPGIASAALTVEPGTLGVTGSLRSVAVIRVDALQRPTALGATWELQISDGPGESTRFPVAAIDRVVGLAVLAWTRAGILVRIETYDPATSRYGFQLTSCTPNGEPVSDNEVPILERSARGRSAARPLTTSRPQTGVYPVAVATEVGGSGRTVPAAAPTWSRQDRSHLRFLGLRAGTDLGPALPAGGLLLVVVTGALVILRHRRRRSGWRA